MASKNKKINILALNCNNETEKEIVQVKILNQNTK